MGPVEPSTEPTPPIPPAPEQSAPVAPPAPVPAQIAPQKGRGGCFKGCLVVLVVLVVLAIGVGALVARIPQQLGWWPSGASLLAGTPDRAGAAAMLDELKAEGVDTTGLTLYVLPVTGEDGTLAYAILDTSAGFDFPTASVEGRNPIPDMFTRLAAGKAATDAGVAQVAIEYRDPTGQSLGVLTASRASIHDFASGATDEATFANGLHGTFNPGAALTTLAGGSR